MKGLIGRASFQVLWTALLGSAISATCRAAAPESVPGEYIVKLRHSISINSIFSKQNPNSHEDILALSEELGSYIKSAIPEMNIVVVKRAVIESDKSALSILNKNSMVKYAEPNYIYRINKTPNDPLLIQLWGIKNTGAADSSGAPGVAGVDIGAEQAWDIETGSEKTVIAVIDTGVLFENEEFKGNIWTNEAELNGKPGVDDDANGVIDDIHGYNALTDTGSPLDDHGHGSHCSGTIGARGDDGKGLVGVNWHTQIMPIKFLSAQGSGSTEGAIKAINYATKMGAKIMSNSWGGGGFSQALKDAIDAANAKGALFVAAAGNESNNNDAEPTYPAGYTSPNVLSVAAIDNKGQIAGFSNFGKKTVHVGAPGVRVYSLTTTGYQSWSGTSMATPHVAGIAGLVASHFPEMSGTDIKNRIIATAKPISGLRGKVKTAGLANAYTALTNTQPEPDKDDPSNWTTTAVSAESTHPYKDNADDTWEINVPGVHEFALYFDKFETEANYDVITLFDASGKELGKLSGNLTDTYSITIPGNYVKLKLKSDDSVNGFGFKISKAAYR